MSTVIPTNQAPLTVPEILEQTAGSLVQLGADRVVGVGTDTRQTLAGAAFVALVGQNFDGHAFLGAAVQRGAAVLVVGQGRGGEAPSGPTVIEVPDTLVALGQLAHFHRVRWGGRVVAIAGSAGKTTTRSVTSRLLDRLFPGQVHATLGNLNNRIGVPLTLLGLEPRHRWAVVEVGTNLPGEVATLTRMVRPDVAVLTLIDLEHTEGLVDLAGVAREEGAIFAGLSPDGTAIGNHDDPLVRQELTRHPGRQRSYGERSGAELVIAERRLVSPERTRLKLEMGPKSWNAEVPLSGAPGALAVAAATLVCEELAPDRVLATDLEAAFDSAGEAGRSAVRTLSRHRVLLDDTYNSNPASARQAIRTGQELASLTGGRLWLVLGEMRELGSLSVSEHRALGGVAKASGAAGLFVVGSEAAPVAEGASGGGLSVWTCPEAALVGERLWSLLLPNDVVVVKASRGVRAERIVEDLLALDRGQSEVRQ